MWRWCRVHVLRPAVIGYLILSFGIGFTLYRQENERCRNSQQTRQDIIEGVDAAVYELTEIKPGDNPELDAKIAKVNRILPQPPRHC